MASITSVPAGGIAPRSYFAGSPETIGHALDYRGAAPLTAVGDRGRQYGRQLTPGRLALDAARLMLQQDLWGRATSRSPVLGRLSLLGSLCVAAGGNYTEDGIPGAPDEPEAAAVLATTCELLAERLADPPQVAEMSAQRRLDQLRPVSMEDSVDVQRLLATVHGVPARS